MTRAWLLVALLGAATAATKAFGPVAFGGRELPGWVRRFTDMVPAAVLAALIAVQTATRADTVVVDARMGGVLAATVILASRRPLWMALGAAALVTAAIRWV